VSNQVNVGRVFSEIVSVEAWHSPFDDSMQVARIHADISFHHAKLGDDRDCPVRFSLGIKRAEVQVVIPTNEPLAVVQRSVDRGHIPTGNKTSELNDRHGFEGKLEGAIAPLSAAPLSFSAGGKADLVQCKKSSLTITEKATPNIVRHFASDGIHCWEITARSGLLIGKAWDALTEPASASKEQ